MLPVKMFLMSVLPLFMTLQSSPYQSQQGTKNFSPVQPVFTEIQKSALGDIWVGFYLFNKKNVGAVREFTRADKLGGRPVYLMQDTTETYLLPTKFSGWVEAVCEVDFTLVRLAGESSEKNIETGEEKIERTECEARKPGVVKCDFGGPGKATETVTFQSETGPVYYDGAIDRMELVMDWKPDDRLDASFIDMRDKKLKKIVVTPLGRGKADIGGKEIETQQLLHVLPDDGIEITVSYTDNRKLAQVRWSDGTVELYGYPAGNEKQAHAERVKFAASVPPAQRSPAQVVVALLTGMAKQDTQQVMACFEETCWSDERESDSAGTNASPVDVAAKLRGMWA